MESLKDLDFRTKNLKKDETNRILEMLLGYKISISQAKIINEFEKWKMI